MSRPVRSLRSYLTRLRRQGDLADVRVEVDPCLEAAEIHRRVIACGGPALLFHRPRGAAHPLATNLFGTPDRVRLAFGDGPRAFVEQAVETLRQAEVPSLATLFKMRRFAGQALRIGLRAKRRGPVGEVAEAPDLSRLPVTTSWPGDGGPSPVARVRARPTRVARSSRRRR